MSYLYSQPDSQRARDRQSQNDSDRCMLTTDRLIQQQREAERQARDRQSQNDADRCMLTTDRLVQ